MKASAVGGGVTLRPVSLFNVIKREIGIAGFRYTKPLELIITEAFPRIINLLELRIFARFFFVKLVSNLERRFQQIFRIRV